MPDALGWLLLAAAALIASTVGGVAGFGTGVIMVPVIAWTLGIKAAVPILTVAMRLGNGARMWFSRSEIDGRVVAAFLAGAVPVGIVGATLLACGRAPDQPDPGRVPAARGAAAPLAQVAWGPRAPPPLPLRGRRLHRHRRALHGGRLRHAPRRVLTRPTVAIGLFLGAVMILGSWLGRRLLDRLSEERFVRLVEALLVSFAILFLLFPSR